MDKDQVKQRTYDLFNGGLSCSESVLCAVLEANAIPGDGFAPGVATPFGGGVGRCQEEMCGALAGGLMALGVLRGRSRAGEGWDDVAATAVEFRSRFEGLCGKIRCKDVVDALGPLQDLEHCKRLTADTAGILCDLLSAGAGHGEAPACACGCSCGGVEGS